MVKVTPAFVQPKRWPNRSKDMRLVIGLAVAAISVSSVFAEDAREIVRKSVELDQANWLRMKDYTWLAHETERNLDSKGAVKSEKRETWETLVLYGQPHRRILERDGKPLPPDEQRKEQAKLDKLAAKLENETAEQRQRRVTE